MSRVGTIPNGCAGAGGGDEWGDVVMEMCGWAEAGG